MSEARTRVTFDIPTWREKQGLQLVCRHKRGGAPPGTFGPAGRAPCIEYGDQFCRCAREDSDREIYEENQRFKALRTKIKDYKLNSKGYRRLDRILRRIGSDMV